MRNLLLLLLLVFYSYALTMKTSAGVESYTGRTITMDLDSRMTCFYEPLEKNMSLKLSLDSMPGMNFRVAMRLSSPTAEFSNWVDGEGSASMHHNTTEDGDYEICVNLFRPQRVTLEIFFFHPEKLEKSLDEHMEVKELSSMLSDSLFYISQFSFEIYSEIKFYNKVSVRDEAMQHSNSFYIKAYVIVFCLTNIVVAFVQVVIIHRMFFIDPKRMRV
ncbi:hypothetical protein Aduo_002981 [Ancylostoma duodenale]